MPKEWLVTFRIIDNGLHQKDDVVYYTTRGMKTIIATRFLNLPHDVEAKDLSVREVPSR